MANKHNFFSHDRFLTTSEDIKKTIKKCPTCTKLTNNCSFLMTDTAFSTFKLPTNIKKAFFFIFISNEQASIGHWISLALYRINSACLLIDPLNNTPKSSILHIKLFCQLNSLNLHSFNAIFQTPSSKACGYLNAYFCSRVSILPLNKILELRSAIKNQTVETTEINMIRYVQNHFKITLL